MLGDAGHFRRADRHFDAALVLSTAACHTVREAFDAVKRDVRAQIARVAVSVMAGESGQRIRRLPRCWRIGKKIACCGGGDIGKLCPSGANGRRLKECRAQCCLNRRP